MEWVTPITQPVDMPFSSCSFCEATAPERQELIQGAQGAICDVCAEMAHGLVLDLRELEARSRPAAVTESGIDFT